MIDTLMALWNQNRKKRGIQVVLTFFVMCISISLLFVITTQSAQSHRQNSALVGANPTVPTFGNTVVPNLTPTISVVVGAQTTPLPTQAVQTPPCVATPAGATSRASGLYSNVLVGQATSAVSPTPTQHGVPRKHNDGGGGIPVIVATPVSSEPTTASTPVIVSTPTAVPARSGSGWVSNCTTSNSISLMTSSAIIDTIIHNVWLILGSSLLGTMLFYCILFALKRRIYVTR